MRLLLATDAWFPQINGVVTTLSTMVKKLEAMGHVVEVVSHQGYPTIALPSYEEIRIAYRLPGIEKRIDDFSPDAIHIATEGPIGYKVKAYCNKKGYKFTTSFHTRFPEYIRERFPISLNWTYPIVRKFHNQAVKTLVPTKTICEQLVERGFEGLEVWGRGVDTSLFNPLHRGRLKFEGPVYVNVGRVAPEKNLTAFLDLDLPGTKVVVGDGPLLDEYKRRYPYVLFPGVKKGIELAEYFAAADVFVFPSLTDTFGLVMLEANACGVPVAAFPVPGPLDVIEKGVNGCMHENLSTAIASAIMLDRYVCRNHALTKTWDRIAIQFLRALSPVLQERARTIKEAQWASQATPV